jgi:hypothetical protein
VKYLVNVSGGSGSAVALARTLARYGKENTHAVFADTKAEHPSCYALLDDMERVFGITIVRLSEGSDVWDIFFKSRSFKTPNGACKASVELKIKPLERYRDANFYPDNCTMVIGMDWMEPERQERMIARAKPYRVEFPLTWEPRLAKCDEVAELERLGLTIPEPYKRGHKHNNCAGACILAGQGQWAGLLADDPERFEYYAAQEKEWRAETGKDYTILKDRRGGVLKTLTLYELAERVKAGEEFREWRSTCNCMGLAGATP